MANSFNVTSLPAYVEENSPLLVKRALLSNVTMKYATLQTGVNGVAAINQLDMTIKPYDGSSCGRTTNTDDSFSQRQLTSGCFAVSKDWCLNSLLKKWTATQVHVGVDQELPFEEQLMNGLVNGIASANEKAIWQGTKSADLIDGIVTTLGKESWAGKFQSASGTKTVDRVYAVYKKIPENAKDASIMMSDALFRELNIQLLEKNYFNFATKDSEEGVIVLPGTSTKVYSIPGLTGKTEIIATPWENVVVGTDLEGGQERYDVWFDKNDQMFKAQVNYTLAANVAWLDQTVMNTLGA